MESGWWLWANISQANFMRFGFWFISWKVLYGKLSKSNQSTDFKISVQSIVVHLAVFACCKPPINRQLCLVRVASSASFNPNLEHFWVNGRIVCPEWQWNKENYPHKRPVLDAFWIITPGFVTSCFRRYPKFPFMFSPNRNVTVITTHPRMTRPSYEVSIQ